jgi:hypothetical protein
MAWTWHAVDLKTGKRGPQLRVKTRGQVSRIIGEQTDTQGEVLCWDKEQNAAVPEWSQWTEPGRMLALLVDDDDRPIWGGVILRRIPNETEWVPIAMSTLEHYLDRRYSGAFTFAGTDQATIASTLVQATVTNTGVPFVSAVTATGQLRDRTYLDSEDKTTLSLLTDLVNIQNGIEFTVDLEWTDNTNTVLRYVFRVGTRIGAATAVPTRFEHPGPVQRFTVPQDYTRENGANDVMAVSSGEGDARPKSAHWVDTAKLAAGWVRYEKRWTPSTSITEIPTLDAYGAAELERQRNGLTELSLVANLDTCPRLNADWWLGDDITAALTAPSLPAQRDIDGNWVPGYEKRVRVVGWSIDLDARTLTPNLREY